MAPDGRRVVFTSTRSGEGEIWRTDISGADAVQLTSMSAIPGWPRWSPTGEYVAFHALGVGGSGDIFVVPADGGKPVNLTSHPATDTFPSYSRDGRWIYFTSNRSGRSMIWKVPASGGPAIQVVAGTMAIESPDGTHLFYTEGRAVNSPGVLWRVPVAGGAAVKLAEGVDATGFDVVAGGVYYIERLPEETRLQYLDLASGKSSTIAGRLGTLDAGLGASPDGRTILFTRLDSSVNDLMLVEKFK